MVGVHDVGVYECPDCGNSIPEDCGYCSVCGWDADNKDSVRERLDEVENDWKILVNRLAGTEATLDELHRNFEALEGATEDAIASMRGESGELKARDDYGEDEHLTDVAEGLDHAAAELEAALENPPGDSSLDTGKDQ